MWVYWGSRHYPATSKPRIHCDFRRGAPPRPQSADFSECLAQEAVSACLGPGWGRIRVVRASRPSRPRTGGQAASGTRTSGTRTSGTHPCIRTLTAGPLPDGRGSDQTAATGGRPQRQCHGAAEGEDGGTAATCHQESACCGWADSPSTSLRLPLRNPRRSIATYWNPAARSASSICARIAGSVARAMSSTGSSMRARFS